jgi:hypothetical protein
MKFLKSIALTTALLATSVSASQIEVDLNDDGSSATAAMDWLTINYTSHTTYNAATQDITTFGGVDAIGETFGFLDTAVVADFGSMVGCGVVACGTENTLKGVPDLLSGFLGAEYFTSGLGLTYGISLSGSLVGGELQYTSGTLDMYSYSFADADTALYEPTLLFTTEFQSGGVFSGQQIVRTTVTDVTVAGEDTFFLTDFGLSFEDYMTQTTQDISLYIVQTVDANQLATDITAAFAGDEGVSNDGVATAYISAPHNASIVFDVPEPTSITILGLGLLGLAGTKRRNS